MSWWNDFSTHRNGGVVDGLPRPRQHPASDSFSTQETATQGAADHHEHHTSNANSPNKSTYVSKANLSDTSVGSGFASHEATWGTATECSDVGSLWQTTTSVCGVTESDQLGVSAAVSAYGSPALQQQQEKPPAQQEEPPAQHPLQPLLLFPTARAVEGVQSSSTKKGARRGSGSNSDSSDAYCSGGPVGVLSFAMDYYGPSFTSGTEGFKTNAATYSRGGHASSSTHTINDDNDSVVSGDIDEAVDKDVRYEEVDVGTISSLIAALQVRDAANLTDSDAPNAEDEEGKKAGRSSCAQDKPSARDSQAQADTGRGVDVTANSAAANKQQHQQHEVGHTTMIANLAPVFHDPNAGASLIASANTTQSISRRHSSNMYNNSTSGSALAHNASSSSGFYEVPLGEAPSGSVVSTSGRAGPGASPRHHINEVVPLQLTSSTLHNVLASFQSALVERSSDVPLPGTIGDLFNATGRGTSSQNGSNSSGAAGGSRLCHYGSTAQEDWGSQTSAAPATAGASVAVTACGSSGDASAVLEAPVTARNGSPVMRGRVNSVVAHKLNLDGAARRSQMQDLRGSGGFPPAAASLDSTCSSDTHTPTLSTHGRLCAPQHVYTQERAASPDSSGDCFLAHTSSSVLGMLHHHQRVTSSVTTEGFVTPHHHMRTASEVSLPAAAATYHGGSALQQRIDDRGCIAVVDPQRRKLHVPLSAIHMTKALNGRLKTPSLCLLYQLGRCRQGENCYQVHVDSAIVERLRADAKNMPCCCFQHGDSNSQVMDRTAYEGRSLGIAGQFSVPLTRVAYTAGLQRVLQDQPACAPVKASVLCRLHGQPGGCRFGADCRFVHVCCQILQNELASIMANAVAAAQQQQQQSRPANGSPLLVDLINNGLIPSSSGTMHGGASTAMMSLNNAASSVVSAADFSLSQFSQSVPASSTAVMNAFASRVPPSSQQQQSSTPPSVTMQPLPCASTLSSPSAGTYYTLTKLQPQVSQVQTPAGRPFPLQASLLGSPPSACHDHVRTLSTHSNGTYQSYASPPLAQTPNHSEVASPINMGLSMARSLNTFPASTATTAGGSGGAFPSLAQHQLSHQTTPLQRHQPSSLAQQQQQQQQQPQRLLGLQQHQQSASQQIYVQQMNTDGSVSLVPINVMQDFGGSGV
ncbi:hypothetical protein conserved [Leishmania donovani]|uniref:Hypothetical_protein_conserved n=1 Tax=Leishmania donovani TaxID=5661 RepID=A0A6J8FB61_LEIDO|nr:hypothetical protein conserved [Leishmania donovani]VDZ44654.1 hypothetical_protein_conserved [Leishmania donovani]